MKGTTTAMALVLFGVLGSCSRDEVGNKPMTVNKLKYTFDVHEQSNVKKYVVELSTDGRNWTDGIGISASTKLEDTYTIVLDLGRYVTDTNQVLYSRIKAIDADEGITYSRISINNPNP